MANLKFSNVSFAYGNTQPVLKEINLELSSNEIVGILGPNGAGKSTLLKIANGLVRPQLGEVLLNNKDISKQATSRLAGEIIVTFQFTRQQFFTSTVEKELLTTLSLHEKNKSLQIHLFESLITQFGLKKLRDHHPYTLSGGEQRRLAMALAMAVPATFFLLDEPTANADQEALAFLFKILKKTKKEGKGVLIVSHDIEFQLAICDQLVILIDGSIQFTGTPLDIINAHKKKQWNFLEIPEIYPFIQRLEREISRPDLLESYLAQSDFEKKHVMISGILGEK